jgi:hypothetical protein
MQEEFEEMASAIFHDATTCPRLHHCNISAASLEDLCKECARRIVADPFLLLAGRRLFSDYLVVRLLSRSLFGWLYAAEARPAFLT